MQFKVLLRTHKNRFKERFKRHKQDHKQSYIAKLLSACSAFKFRTPVPYEHLMKV